MQIQIVDNKDLKRDMYNKAVINSNKSTLESMKINRMKRLENDERLSKLERDVCDVKSSINEILTLLKK